MLKNKKVDATQGPLIKLIFLYTVPLILSTLVQNLFNAVDIMVLGNLADTTAVASVGATSTVIHLIISAFVGISGGLKIVFSRYFGAHNAKGIKRLTDTSLISAVIIGIVLAAVGFFLSPVLLDLMKCPAECREGAILYIRIYMMATPAIMLYNFGSAALTSSGDTQRPLYYIIAGGFLNAILNVILCLLLTQKVAAVAIATAAAQVLGAFLVIRRLTKIEGEGRLELSDMHFHWPSFGQMLRYGLPLGINNALYPIANLQIQSAINSYGVSAIAGNSAAITIEGFVSPVQGAFPVTATVFMGQNIGAGKDDRVKKSFWYCLLIGLAASQLLGMAVYFTSEIWLRIILGSDLEAYGYANSRMMFILLFQGVASAYSTLSHAIQSYGYASFSSFNSILWIFCFRLIWMNWIYPAHQTFQMLMLCFLVSWTMMLITNSIAFPVCKHLFERKRRVREENRRISEQITKHAYPQEERPTR